MADAQSVSDGMNGKDPNSGKWLSWRLVHLLRDAVPGDLNSGDTAEGPNDSGSLYDHITTLAKIFTRRFVYNGQRYDAWDMLTILFKAHMDSQQGK